MAAAVLDEAYEWLGSAAEDEPRWVGGKKRKGKQFLGLGRAVLLKSESGFGVQISPSGPSDFLV
jgi:hypothetical protein